MQGRQSVSRQSAGPQYSMTVSRRRLSVGFFQSWHWPQLLHFYLFNYFYFYFEFGAPPKK